MCTQFVQNTMSNFSLAECNEISEKFFSHTPLGPGYRSCDLCGGQLFLLRPPLPTLLRCSDKNPLASWTV